LGREKEQNKNACSSCLPLCRCRSRSRMCFDAARLREAVFTPARYRLRCASGMLHCAVVSSSCRRFGMFYPEPNTPEYSICSSSASLSMFRQNKFLALQLCVQERQFFSSPKRPDRLWGPFSGHRGFFRCGGVTRL
jgi:hypothetical protein